MKTAMIFDIQRNSFVDGPGIRTAVFFKGCNLNCKWCHNPEGISSEKQIMFYTNRCKNCKKCVAACKHGAISENLKTDITKCIFCGDCELACLNDARKICGKDYTVQEVFNEIIKDKPFYDASGGGVTFSGGECMLQTDFLVNVLKECKANDIHTAIDTAGNVPWENFEKIMPYVDLFLYDIKCISEDLHKKFTGQSNERILFNLIKLLKMCPEKICIRVPLIAEFNANETEINKIAYFLHEYKEIRVELLPYHALGENKKAALGQKNFSGKKLSEELIENFNVLIKNR